jgi:hypothetical protein
MRCESWVTRKKADILLITFDSSLITVSRRVTQGKRIKKSKRRVRRDAENAKHITRINTLALALAFPAEKLRRLNPSEAFFLRVFAPLRWSLFYSF